ncbi:MAG: 23S rRNA (adenine(2503)-C(2))-methyltransferase RlmN [Lachnospiraceae bacterium]|nr:23S rRNA (adenine(2503)-C(2))-methyltransferase RlmN [Lachnospiraceae bacterium]
MKDIRNLTLDELKTEIENLGEARYRASQIFEWLHVKLVRDFDEMSNLSKDLRNKLKNNYEISNLKPVRVSESKIDSTKKFLFETPDGNFIESVWMQYHHGNSVCISSQIGCRMGCRFCASTIDGLERSLTSAEMLEQIYEIIRITGEKVSNVVVMGMGEPMDNYDNVIKFVKLLTCKDGLNISGRSVTVSTCGIVPMMKKFAEEGLQVTLALSLHAPNDAKRRELMPIANSYSIKECLEACDYYFEKTGRRVSYEYALVSGVNDNDEEAEELIKLLKGHNGHVNLIPVNPLKERDYKRSDKSRIFAFQNKLEKNGINVTIRREMGKDIDGACGQLRRRHNEEAPGVLS